MLAIESESPRVEQVPTRDKCWPTQVGYRYPQAALEEALPVRVQILVRIKRKNLIARCHPNPTRVTAYS